MIYKQKIQSYNKNIEIYNYKQKKLKIKVLLIKINRQNMLMQKNNINLASISQSRKIKN